MADFKDFPSSVFNYIPVDTETDNLFEDYGSFGSFILDEEKSGSLLVQKDLQFHQSFQSPLPCIPLYSSSQIKVNFKDYVSDPITEISTKTCRVRSLIRRYRKLINRKDFIQKDCTVLAHLKDDLLSKWDSFTMHNIPLSVLKIFDTYRRLNNINYIPLYNSNYVGGCLKVCQFSGSHYLFNPKPRASYVGKDCLTIHRLSEDDPLVVSKLLNTIPCSQKIFELSVQPLQDKICVAARYESSVSLWTNILERSEYNVTVPIKCPSSIALSPFVPHEILVADRDGNYNLVNSRGRLTAVASEVPFRFPCHESWRKGQFTAHPRRILLTDQSAATIHDMRSPSSTSDLFALPSKILNQQERIVNTTQYPTNDFLNLVVTDYHLIVMDERFTAQPVVMWKHMLLKPPTYVSVLPNISTRDLIFLATQKPAETCVFEMSESTSAVPCRSIDRPWRASIISDFTRRHDLEHISDYHCAKKRFETSLLGVDAVNFRKSAFALLQLDAMGDVFYQIYEEGGDDISDKTMSSGPTLNPLPPLPTKVHAKCKAWLESIAPIQMNDKNDKGEENEESEISIDNICLQKPYNPDPKCLLCCESSVEPSSSSPLSSTAQCPSCGNTLSQAYEIYMAAKRDGIISETLTGTEQITFDDKLAHETDRLLNLRDVDSRIVLALWNDDHNSLSSLIKLRDEQNKAARRRFFRKKRRDYKQSLHESSEDVDLLLSKVAEDGGSNLNGDDQNTNVEEANKRYLDYISQSYDVAQASSASIFSESVIDELDFRPFMTSTQTHPTPGLTSIQNLRRNETPILDNTLISATHENKQQKTCASPKRMSTDNHPTDDSKILRFSLNQSAQPVPRAEGNSSNLTHMLTADIDAQNVSEQNNARSSNPTRNTPQKPKGQSQRKYVTGF